jgi:hypothetical protein
VHVAHHHWEEAPMSGRSIASAITCLVVTLVLGIPVAAPAEASPDALRVGGDVMGTSGGDCNDTDPDIYPDHAEIQGNRKDDNCNGLADEAPNGEPSTDTGDGDGDGQSPATGDCDDTNADAAPGLPETPGNLIDDDCDGMADEDGDGNPSSDVLDHDGDGVTIGDDRIFASGFE